MRLCCTQWNRVPSATLHSNTIAVSLRRSAAVVCHARKKGKKGGKQKKESLLGDLAKKPVVQPWQTTEIIMQHLLMVESYRRAAGKPLMENVEIEKVADALYEAPFAIMAHNRFREDVKDEESVFTYGNKAALDAFQAVEFGDFVGQLSSFCVAGLETGTVSTREGELKKLVEGTSSPASAGEAETEFSAGSESAEQQEEAVEGEVDDERERRVGAGWDAHLLNGTGWRIGLGGRKIFIEFELFNIYSPTGQAACFKEYKLEDGTIVKFGKGGEGVPLPTAEGIAAAERAIEEQGDEVRRLKEVDGKDNSDPDVKDAVEELIKRKEHVAALKQALADAAEPAEAAV